jgi:hypothetical protein
VERKDVTAVEVHRQPHERLAEAAVLWPVVRLLPGELRDAARVDRATPGQDLLRVVVPLRPLLVVPALGEVGAGKPAGTPGMDTFTVAVFDRMHNGVTGEVASLCLLLLAFLVLAGAEVAAWSVALSPPRGHAVAWSRRPVSGRLP